MMMLGLGLSMAVQAQDEETESAYFTVDEMPDMMVFLPAPPDST